MAEAGQSSLKRGGRLCGEPCAAARFGRTSPILAGDATRRDRFRAERLAMDKQAARFPHSACQLLRDGLQGVLRSAVVGEVQARREQLRREASP